MSTINDNIYVKQSMERILIVREKISIRSPVTGSKHFISVCQKRVCVDRAVKRYERHVRGQDVTCIYF